MISITVRLSSQKSWTTSHFGLFFHITSILMNQELLTAWRYLKAGLDNMEHGLNILSNTIEQMFNGISREEILQEAMKEEEEKSEGLTTDGNTRYRLSHDQIIDPEVIVISSSEAELTEEGVSEEEELHLEEEEHNEAEEEFPEEEEEEDTELDRTPEVRKRQSRKLPFSRQSRKLPFSCLLKKLPDGRYDHRVYNKYLRKYDYITSLLENDKSSNSQNALFLITKPVDNKAALLANLRSAMIRVPGMKKLLQEMIEIAKEQ